VKVERTLRHEIAAPEVFRMPGDEALLYDPNPGPEQQRKVLEAAAAQALGAPLPPGFSPEGVTVSPMRPGSGGGAAGAGGGAASAATGGGIGIGVIAGVGTAAVAATAGPTRASVAKSERLATRRFLISKECSY